MDQLVELEGGNGKEIRSEGAQNQKKVEKHWVKLSQEIEEVWAFTS